MKGTRIGDYKLAEDGKTLIPDTKARLRKKIAVKKSAENKVKFVKPR